MTAPISDLCRVLVHKNYRVPTTLSSPSLPVVISIININIILLYCSIKKRRYEIMMICVSQAIIEKPGDDATVVPYSIVSEI